jgi:hypothetical protein
VGVYRMPTNLKRLLPTAASRFALIFPGPRGALCTLAPLLGSHIPGGFLSASTTLLSKVLQCFFWKFASAQREIPFLHSISRSELKQQWSSVSVRAAVQCGCHRSRFCRDQARPSAFMASVVTIERSVILIALFVAPNQHLAACHSSKPQIPNAVCHEPGIAYDRMNHEP